VREALAAIGVQGLTVTEVRGFGRQKANRDLSRRRIHHAICAEGEAGDRRRRWLADRVVETIEAARTGRIGDGKYSCSTSKGQYGCAPRCRADAL
jgi:nitrogen regulatory protein P-II 2